LQVARRLGDSQIDQFRKFLDDPKNAKCKNKLTGWVSSSIDAISKSAGKQIFYATETFSTEAVASYVPWVPLVYTFVGIDENWATFFGRGFAAVTNSNALVSIGVPGIYAPKGPDDPFFQGEAGLYNLEHELFHYVTGKTDHDIVGQFKIPKKDDKELDTTAVTRWFQQGCPD